MNNIGLNPIMIRSSLALKEKKNISLAVIVLYLEYVEFHLVYFNNLDLVRSPRKSILFQPSAFAKDGFNRRDTETIVLHSI